MILRQITYSLLLVGMMTFNMPEKQYRLWKQLYRDRLYTKPYKEFLQQFSDPQRVQTLYNRMRTDKLLTQGLYYFRDKFFTEGDVTAEPRYEGTRHYAKPGKDSLVENIALEKKFGDVYGDKNLWTRYAYLNHDENLKDMIVSNENKVDPYLLAGTLSAEGVIDELHGVTSVDPYYSIADYEPPQISTGQRVITGSTWYGLDDFGGRYDEFKQKGLTSLEPLAQPYPQNIDSTKAGMYFLPSPFTQETGKQTLSADFLTPQAGINAMSSYLKNIQNMVDSSGVRATPEEKEFLIHVGYNHGEGGLSSYLKKYKTGKEIIEKIKEEKPEVYKNVQKRVIVSKELRQSRAFEHRANSQK